MKRASAIEALLRRATADFGDVRTAYQASLHEKIVRDDLKVAIKNIFENLRSCLDYLAQEMFENCCGAAKKPDRLYFPIRPTAAEFATAIAKDFPGLPANAKGVHDILEAVQPYQDPWLGKFNKLNNHNKHQDLVEQTRTESRQVTVRRGGGSVSWSGGVTFSGDVRVMGVPIDPRTQLPVPGSDAKVEAVTWVSFRFHETGDLVIPFVDESIRKVTKLFGEVQPLL